VPIYRAGPKRKSLLSELRSRLATSPCIHVWGCVTLEEKEVERQRLFILHRERARRLCEVRWDFESRPPEQRSREEQRLFLQLGPSLVAVNVWLMALGADSGYSFGTVYEYAKVLKYTLNWLAQKPVQLQTGYRIELSLFSLGRAGMRALFAWLDIPASDSGARQKLSKTGRLPAGYKEHRLSAATRNLRLAVLSTFYDWLIAEYLPDNIPMYSPPSHPLERVERPLSPRQLRQQPDGLLAQPAFDTQRPSKLFRRPQDTPLPQALSPEELKMVFDTIPLVSFGHNAANRNGALVKLLLWGMLRESELIGATWEAVNGQVLQVYGKGRKYRIIPIVDSETWTYLNTYTNELRLPLRQRFHGALLRQLDHEDVPITIHSIEHLLGALKSHFRTTTLTVAAEEQRLRTSLCEKLHSHIFRATGATLMAAAGMGVVTLSLLMGHASTETTQRYYLDAEQMNLPLEVQKICLRIQEACDSLPSTVTPVHSAFGWYERKGYHFVGKESHVGRISTED
jgi:integrase